MKKINILLSLFIGIFMTNIPAEATDVNDWTTLKNTLENNNVSEINFTNDIIISDENSPRIEGNKIINGHNYKLDGNQELGFTVGSVGMTSEISVTINKVVFENFSNDANHYNITDIFHINENSTLNINDSTFQNNKELSYGIINLSNGNVTLNNVTVSNNSSEGQYGGILYNEANNGSLKVLNSKFEDNTVSGSGGAIYTALSTNLSVENTNFIKNTADSNGGAIYNYQAEVATIKNSNFESNVATNGGAIYSKGDFYNDDDPRGVTIIDSSFKNNNANKKGGAIFVDTGFLDIIANNKDVEFTGNTDSNGSNAIFSYADGYDAVVTLNANTDRKIVFNDKLNAEQPDTNYKNIININKSGSYPTAGTIVFNNEVKNNEVNLYNGTLALGSYNSSNGNFDNTVNFNVYGGNVSLVDGNIRNTNLGNLTLHNDLNLGVDVNFEQKTMDTITVDSFSANGKNINITNVNILAPTTEETFSISPLGTFTDENVRTFVANAIKYSAGEIAYSPIFKYNATYDPDTAMLNFTQCHGSNASDRFNPAILSSSVGAQLGSYLTQLNIYDQAFSNMDMLMLMTKEQRISMKYANKYASLQGADNGGVITFSPNQIPEKQKGLWLRPFTTFEKVGLKNGPDVKNIGYGSLFGGDSDLIELKHGWDMTYSFYGGYNGSNQNYNGVSIYQNGGTLGTGANWYKGNFFTGLTANVSANVGEASSMYGNEAFTTLATGIASKTGYNWELINGKFIIQPSFLMSYTFANTFDYTNAAGVKISSDPLHAIQLAPGLKFIGNLKNGWQPYVGLQMVWNLIDKSKFYANNVNLPDMSVDPYFQYGLGIQKRVGERFTGFGQAMIKNGGRNGITLQFGFRWAI